VYLYDSLPTFNRAQPTLDAELQRQLRQLYGADGVPLKVGCCVVTLQPNGIDCGVFAIAFATDLCAGTDPAVHEYDVWAMRTHIVSAFSNGEMVSFPKVTDRQRQVNYVKI
jgi:Ulp1 family protease